MDLEGLQLWDIEEEKINETDSRNQNPSHCMKYKQFNPKHTNIIQLVQRTVKNIEKNSRTLQKFDEAKEAEAELENIVKRHLPIIV